MMNDNELLKMIKNKDEGAFNEFIQKYMNLFYSIITQIFKDEGSKEDISDCFSESLIYIWENIEKCDPKKITLRNWSCLIVMHQAQNYIKKCHRQNRKLIKYQQETANKQRTEESAETIYFNKWAQEDMINKLKSFSKTAQQAFIFRYIYNMKPREIAEILKITPKQIDNYLAYVKNKLRKDTHGDL